MAASGLNVKISVDPLTKNGTGTEPWKVEENGDQPSKQQLPPLQYPFHKVSDEMLQFPRRQLYFQNSKMAILVANPNRHIEVTLTKLSSSKRPEADDESSTDDKPLVFKPLKTTLKKPPKSGKKSKRGKVNKISKVNKKKSDIELSVNVKHICSNNTEKAQVSLVTESPSKNRRLSDTNDFLLLDVDELCLILSSDELETYNELMVFRYAMRWLKFELDERSVEADRVLRCVRFGLIKPRDLVKCHAKCLELGFLEIPSLCAHLYSGLLWSCAKYYHLEHLIPHMKPEHREIAKENVEVDSPVVLTDYRSSSAITIYSYSAESSDSSSSF
ncbi:hypothetical protein CHUAL_002803 [Chamberlinius hualienensis]